MRTTVLEWRRSQWLRAGLLAMVALSLIVGFMARTPVAHAANINVAAGEVAIAANGQCSLIEAIINANNNAATHADCAAGSGADTITLPAASTFTITGSYVYAQGNTGLPQITSVITIDGNGSTLTRDGAAGVVRFLALASGSNLTINDLTLNGGQATSDVGGGAIYNNSATLTINDSAFTNNSGTGSQGGGAIHANAGTTTVNRTTFTSNQSGNSGGGGGIYANNGATVIVTDSTFTQNTAANTNGGAISASYSGANSITVSGSTLNNNSANGGGAVHVGAGTFTMNNSTVSGNSSLSAGGGGFYNNGGTMTLRHTTVTGNTTTGSGGGILHNSSALHLIGSIISGNSSNSGFDSGYEVTAWSGIATSTYNVFGRSGISNSRAFNGFTPSGTNFNATDGGTPTAIASILNTTLANNGGPTQTHALVAGSPAIDRALSADCAAAPISGTDQRGYTRNVDGNAAASSNECDSGAYEYLGAPPPPPTGTIVIVKAATPADDTLFGFTHTIDLSGPFDLQDPSDDTKTFSDVPVGSYTVTEDGETGWTLDSITCTDPTQNSSGNIQTKAATIDLAAGETVICTFSNSRDTGSIVIIKDADPEGDTGFSFTEDIESTGFTLVDDGTVANTKIFSVVPTGTYTVAEDGETGWTLDDIDCNDGNSTENVATKTATIKVEKHETVACTFSNSLDTGTIRIVKAATPADDTLFGFTHTINLSGPFSLQDPSDDTKSFSDIPLGSYTVTEDMVPGWVVDTITCDDNNSTGNPATRQATINLDSRDETVTCTFTNEVAPTPTGYCAPGPNVGPYMTDGLGIGQGSPLKAFQTRKIIVPNYANLVGLYGQLAAVDIGVMKYVRFVSPTGGTVQIHAPTSPAYRKAAVDWWGSDLTPAPYVKGQFFWGGKGSKSPRAFVLWPTYRTTVDYANVFTTFDESSENHVYYNISAGWYATQTQLVDIPPTQVDGADLVVEVAVVDVNGDGRAIILEVTAGGVTETRVLTAPNAKPSLNMETFILPNVPAGTDEVEIVLESPTIGEVYPLGGDSAAMIGARAGYACDIPTP